MKSGRKSLSPINVLEPISERQRTASILARNRGTSASSLQKSHCRAPATIQRKSSLKPARSAHRKGNMELPRRVSIPPWRLALASAMDTEGATSVPEYHNLSPVPNSVHTPTISRRINSQRHITSRPALRRNHEPLSQASQPQSHRPKSTQEPPFVFLAEFEFLYEDA